MSTGNRRERRAAAGAARDPLEARYGRTASRNALAPGLLGAIVLLAGLALVGTSGFVFIRYATAILALVLAIYAWQARAWVWLPFLAAIAVIWNPTWPLPFHGQWWLVAQLAGAACFTLAAVLIRGGQRPS